MTVSFKPKAMSTYSGTVTVNSDATGGPNTISASGTGVVAPFIVSPRRVLPDNFAFSYDSIAGKAYVVEVKTNVITTNWIPLQTNSGDGTRQSYTNSTTAAPQRYFRLRMQ